MDPLRVIRLLSCDFTTPTGGAGDATVRIIDDVSFSAGKGKTLGIVGESGSGKSVTALSILRLIPRPPLAAISGEVLFAGVDLLKLPEKQMRTIRGRQIAFIFQEPMTSLNPVLSVGDQIMEMILLHEKTTTAEARIKAADLLREVGIPGPESRLKSYPHEMSGGMRQRIMIAMALSCNPRVLIADEPTTALDVTVQAQILELFRQIQTERDMAVLFITHDLGVVAEIADEVMVMQQGRIVEYDSVENIFHRPAHPYTRKLLSLLPRGLDHAG